MKLLPFCLQKAEEISACLQVFRQNCPPDRLSVLAIIFSADDRTETVKRLVNFIAMEIPDVVIAGCTSSGEIINGHLELEKIVVTFLVFTESEAESVLIDCHERSTEEAGKELMTRIDQTNDLAGFGFLATLKTLPDIRNFTDKIKKIPLRTPIFGGSADSYANKSSYVNNAEYTCVFSRQGLTDKGIVGIIFKGKNLHMTVCSYHGWKPLGASSSVTSMLGQNTVCTIDNAPTTETYEKYLGITPSENVFDSLISFPIIMERDGREIARMPIKFYEDGSVGFGGDFYVGENVRLGYGDPNAMILEARNTQQELADFQPEGVLLFSCIIRRMYLHNDVNMELPLYDAIAPTAGFYTYGEFQRFRGHQRVNFLNGSLVAIGLREGNCPLDDGNKKDLLRGETVFKDEKISLIKGLANFVTVMAKELTEANAKLSRLADSDRLTELLNRGAIELIFQKELEKLNDNGGSLSAIMLDIDHFKRINDNHGHEVGDQVLKQLATILREQVRGDDYVGRWGGEEFVILLPGCSILKAVSVAERIRLKIPAKIILPDGTRVTASFGVTGAKPGDILDEVYKALDNQLYFSKEHGRNKVSVAVSRI